jgi:hypothetical protein
VFVYQLGDHDPSGADTWRAFSEKVTGLVFERYNDAENWLHFERLAVTPEQIASMSLPHPADQADRQPGREVRRGVR